MGRPRDEIVDAGAGRLQPQTWDEVRGFLLRWILAR